MPERFSFLVKATLFCIVVFVVLSETHNGLVWLVEQLGGNRDLADNIGFIGLIIISGLAFLLWSDRPKKLRR